MLQGSKFDTILKGGEARSRNFAYGGASSLAPSRAGGGGVLPGFAASFPVKLITASG